MQKLIDKLVELDACSEAIIWAKKQESLQAAWENCNNFNWLCWLTAQLDCKGQTDKIRETYNDAVAPAWAAYVAAVAPAWAAYDAAIAQAEVAYDAGAKAACDAAVASINCEFCNKLREIISFEDVLKQGDFYAETY